jgi:hypothetical protein
MSNRKRPRNTACKNKVRYSTLTEAQEAAAEYAQAFYQCPACKAFHLTTATGPA